MFFFGSEPRMKKKTPDAEDADRDRLIIWKYNILNIWFLR